MLFFFLFLLPSFPFFLSFLLPYFLYFRGSHTITNPFLHSPSLSFFKIFYLFSFLFFLKLKHSWLVSRNLLITLFLLNWLTRCVCTSYIWENSASTMGAASIPLGHIILMDGTWHSYHALKFFHTETRKCANMSCANICDFL